MTTTPINFLYDRLSSRHARRSLPLPLNGIDFCSNDYLGFVHNGLINRIMEKSESHHFGSTGSRLVSGTLAATVELEAKIAKFHSAEAALLFSSGYAANLGLMSSFQRDDVEIYYDEHIHASIRDGIRLSGARSQPFRHNDASHLCRRLMSSQKTPVVVVESIYSMSGKQAPLSEITEICAEHQALLIVDEAHSAGVMGGGLTCELDLTDMVFARTIAYGKAFGCFGASIVGSALLKDYLVNFARSFIYSTALPPASVAAISSAYDFLKDECTGKHAQIKLCENIEFFKNAVREKNLKEIIQTTESAIQCLFLSQTKLISLEKLLRIQGFETKAMLSPTVKRGTERLRIVLHAFNSRQEMDWLLTLIQEHL